MATQKKSISSVEKQMKLATKTAFDALRSEDDTECIRKLIKEGVDMEARDSRGRTLLLFAGSRRRKKIVNLLIKKGANVNDKCYADQYSILHYASRNGWLKIVSSLVSKVFNLNAFDAKGETALHHATALGHYKVVLCLLQHGAALEWRSFSGFTPLMKAAQFGRKRIFELLLYCGANGVGYERPLLYFYFRNRWTEFLLRRRYLMEASDITSSSRHLQLVDFLLEKGAVIDNTGDEIIHREALYYASYEGHLDVVKWLVKRGGDMKRLCDLNLRHESGHTALGLASSSGHLEIVKLLVTEGADVNAREMGGYTALHAASGEGHLEIVKWLVEQGSDINARDRNGGTALQNASEYLEIVKYLVRQGADINMRDRDGCSILHSASKDNKLEVVKWLVEKETDVKRIQFLDTRSRHGFTALCYASMNGHLELVKLLAEKGSNIHARSYSGETALQLASEEGHLEIVKFLVEMGAATNTRERIKGYSPLHLATITEKPELVKWLVENEADSKGISVLDARSRIGNTALSYASMNGNLEIVKLLVHNGANVNVKNRRGETPLIMAAVNNYKHVVDFLMWSGANPEGYNHQKMTMLHLASASGWTDTVHYLIMGGCDLEARDEEGSTSLWWSFSHGKLGAAQTLLQAGARWNTVLDNGYLPLVNMNETKKSDFIKLFIENGAYIETVDYRTVDNDSLQNVLRDVKLCCQAIVNRFNNCDLPELYQLPIAERLPLIERLRIEKNGKVAREIEQKVEIEIQSKGHCNIHEVGPEPLCILAVRSISEHYKKETLKNPLKRMAAFESVDDYEPPSKSICLR